MPVPTSIDDLSQTAGSNSPAGSDSPTVIDDHIRALASFIAILRDKLDGTDNTGTVKAATFSGTHTFSSGNLIAGTFTPTISNGTNVASSTARLANYLRTGSIVTVSGTVDIQPTSTGATEIYMTLPVSSSFADGYECAGLAKDSDSVTTADQNATVTAITSDTKVRLRFNATLTSSRLWAYHYTYRIV